MKRPTDAVLLDRLDRLNLLGTASAKTVKGRAEGYETYILYLAPARESGFQACPMASKGCEEACLYTSGHGRFDSVKKARLEKTHAFFRFRREFMARLHHEIGLAVKREARKGRTAVFRLNGTSDIRWETVSYIDPEGLYRENIFAAYPDVQFYDYTKIPNRRNLPANYHLTFSYSGYNGFQALEAVRNGQNVAVVFRDKDALYWATYGGTRFGSSEWLEVVNGDHDDLRFLDPKGVVVGLYAKGDAKTCDDPFVVDNIHSIPLGSLPTLKANLACTGGAAS